MSIHLHNLDELNSVFVNNKYVIIKCSAVWCGPCKMIAPYFESLAKKYSNICFVSVDVDESEDIATYLNVQSMPTFYSVANGNYVSKFSGAAKETLNTMVEELLAK